MNERSGAGRRVLAIVSLLVLGAAAGITGDRMVQRHGLVGTVRFEDVHADPLRVMDEHFDLTQAQRTRVAAILARRQSDVDAAWHTARAHIATTVDSVVEEIAAVLDPADRPRFRALADSLHSVGSVRSHRR